VARAQQPALLVIGFLYPSSPDAIADRVRAFRGGPSRARALQSNFAVVTL
jgi:hypothetical protein